ncbi:MAG TPA: rod shape-determining protein MreC [Candidatus Binataceae bacterium]|jgi:rod shape-determining protein MreC|nr:rod shape-determining protein MreC [Candidatus Binataceae bacterium]
MQDPKETFLWRNRVALAGGVLLLLAAHMLSSGVKQGDTLARPQGLVSEALRPFQAASSRMGHSATDLVRHYVWLVNVTRENERLTKQVAQLSEQQTRMVEVEAQNRRLAELLDLKEALDLKVVAADVIGSDATGMARTLIVGQGSGAGLQPGMGVIATGGVVGKLIASSPNAARVILLSDHNCAIDAFDQRSRTRGIVSGMADDGVIMKYVERIEDLKPGDPVITSGLDGVFPRGLLIGYLSAIDRKGPGLFLTVSIKPAVDLRTLEQVLVITQTPPHLADPGKS